MITIEAMGRLANNRVKIAITGYRDSYAWDSFSDSEIDVIIAELRKAQKFKGGKLGDDRTQVTVG